MDEDRIADVLKSERMGHEVPGMRGVYGHVSDAMRAELKAALQERWAPHSVNEPVLRHAQSCLSSTPCWQSKATPRTRSAPKSLPKSDTSGQLRPRKQTIGHLTWKNSVELRGFEPLTPSMRTSGRKVIGAI